MTQRQPVYENAGVIFERVKERFKHRNGTPELSFYLPALDEITFGIPKERVTIIAARPSEGKTSLSLQTAFRIADTGKMVAYVSLEDDREQLVEKIFCNACKVNNYDLKKGIVEASKIKAAEGLFSNLKLIVLDDFGYNFTEFERVIKDGGVKPEIVFIDYIQMIDPERNASRWDTISEFIRRCKRFAIEEKIAVVILSQVNRMGADGNRPGLHHLKQAGTLEEVADLALILFYPFRYGESSYDFNARTGSGIEVAPRNYLEVQVEKNKTGRTGIVPLRFLGENYRFEGWGCE